MPLASRTKRAPQKGSARPVGTLEEVQKAGLDPLLYASCSEHVPNKSRGCAAWDLCPFAQKGKSGPVNKGVRILKPGGGREVVMACYDAVHYPLLQAEVSDNFYAEICAEEGEKIMASGSVAVPPPPAEAAKGVLATHVSQLTEVTVPPHEKLSNGEAFSKEAAFIKVRERVLAERKARKKVDLLEIHEEIEEMDDEDDEPEAKLEAKPAKRK